MRTTFILLLIVWVAGLRAQSNTVAAGIEAVGSAGGLSISIGQVTPLYMTADGAGLNQGVQQPYPEVVHTGLESMGPSGNSVFPNPSQGRVWVRRTDDAPLAFRLCTADGRLVRTGLLAPMNGSIDLNELPSGTYLLHFIREDRAVGTHRILKTH